MILVYFGFSVESGKENRFETKATSLSFLGGLDWEGEKTRLRAGLFIPLSRMFLGSLSEPALHAVLGGKGGRRDVRNKGRAGAGAGAEGPDGWKVEGLMDWDAGAASLGRDGQAGPPGGTEGLRAEIRNGPGVRCPAWQGHRGVG